MPPRPVYSCVAGVITVATLDSSSAPDGTRQVFGACPLDCPDTCSWVVTVTDGRAVRLQGDARHPFTRGVLCNKVNGYVDYARSPDRLLYPMRRVGPKGAGGFERISWEAALDEIAERLQAVIREFGGEAIWPYVGSGSMGLLQGVYGAGRRLWNVIGTSRHLMTICTIAGGVGTGYTLGDNRVGMDPETLRFSKLIILWGSNTLTTNHHLWRSITTARRNGAHLVVIDPTRTRTADAADSHLALIPGTDAALALGLLHVVLGEGAEDRDFIQRHTLGWDAFRRRILEYPPARVAEICGLPVEAIVELGKRIAHTRPTGIRVTMGLQRHGGGGMAVRTITCIPGVTGDWRYPGGGAGYDTRGFFGVNWAALYRDDLRPRDTRTLSMTRLGEGLLEVTDPPVKALIVYASNPAASVPHQTKIRRALARPDLFTVVVEHFRTDTVEYADIVLPGTMQLEHADIQISYGHLYISWNEPAVPPPGECLPTTEIFRRLARRLGLAEPCLYDEDEEMARQLLDSGHPSLDGITLDRLKERGWMRLNCPEPFVPFADGFFTESGRLEFHSERMAKVGLDPLAGYTPPYEAAQRNTPLADRYPLALIAGADHYFLNSLFANVADQRKRSGPPAIRVHPEDATARGLTTGDEARVFNDRGAFVALVEVTDRVRQGVVASTKGQWPRFVKGEATVNATVDERDSDMGGGAVYHDNRVEIERV
jgi:anaerobic selenocysteine-containing dehydrogenase